MSLQSFPLFFKPIFVFVLTLTVVFLLTSFIDHHISSQTRTQTLLIQPSMARSFVLWLHGLGDSGPANEPIRTLFTSPEFKNTKWLFPSAPHAPVSCNYGAVMPSWFDIHEIPITAVSPKDEKGVLKAVQNVHAMVDKEVAAGTNPENIFICGFSQGGALTLASVLLYPRTLGGGAVFSGWVPFNSSIIERISPEARKTPVLWSHGMADRTVLFEAGQAGPPFLEQAGMKCEFKAYPDLAHSISNEELHTLESWIKAQTAAKVPAIFVFGDSSVDAGNNNYIPTILKSNFAPYGRDFEDGKPTGRFSNGRIATDFISELFGLKPTIPAYLDPQYSIEDFATGVCFASAGSGYDSATSDVLSVIPLWKELDYFKEFRAKLRKFQGAAKANRTLSEALYVMSLGTNDFLENYYVLPRRRVQFTIEEYQNFLIGIAERFIRSLHQQGARKLDLTGIPPMGCLPLERTQNLMSGSNCNEEYNEVAREFNKKLRGLAYKLSRTLPGMRVAYGNVYDIVSQVSEKPLTYGFENAGVGCCATGMFEMGYACSRSLFTCSDANMYVFWDAFHPTERMNRIVADYVMNNNLMEFF